MRLCGIGKYFAGIRTFKGNWPLKYQCTMRTVSGAKLLLLPLLCSFLYDSRTLRDATQVQCKEFIPETLRPPPEKNQLTPQCALSLSLILLLYFLILCLKPTFRITPSVLMMQNKLNLWISNAEFQLKSWLYVRASLWSFNFCNSVQSLIQLFGLKKCSE